MGLIDLPIYEWFFFMDQRRYTSPIRGMGYIQGKGHRQSSMQFPGQLEEKTTNSVEGSVSSSSEGFWKAFWGIYTFGQ